MMKVFRADFAEIRHHENGGVYFYGETPHKQKEDS